MDETLQPGKCEYVELSMGNEVKIRLPKAIRLDAPRDGLESMLAEAMTSGKPVAGTLAKDGNFVTPQNTNLTGQAIG